MGRSEFTIGCVITTCAGREDNLARTLQHLSQTDPKPEAIVVVYDGCPAAQHDGTVPVTIPKHQPGAEQPRNVGARELLARGAVNFVWFLDSDLIFGPGILGSYAAAHALGPDRILIGPYEWLPPGSTAMDPNFRNDMRWASMLDHGPDDVMLNELGPALGSFGGNLVWPLSRFMDVGGFHPQLHHGRCEDGELGLRAASAGVPMSYVRDARAWHVYHPVDGNAALQKNARDVPMLNAWHPWVQERGMILTESDGARFDFACSEPGCDLVMNSHDYWNHVSDHRAGREFTFADPASVRPA